MKTLYVSDLDGTLLNENASLSEKTKAGILKLLERDVPFTIATARSVSSIQKIFEGVPLKLPVIEFNGAFITDLQSGAHRRINRIEKGLCRKILSHLESKGFQTLISSFDGKRDRLYYSSINNAGEEWYIGERRKNKDPRLTIIENYGKAETEEIVCFTLIDTLENLQPEYDRFRKNPLLEAHLQENRYSPGWYWLTLHSSRSTKDQAIIELMKMVGMESWRLTVFGDDTNDIKMLEAADHGVAVSNAKEEVKRIADEIILSHTEDAIIEYILEKEIL